jgi:putative ABC transport system substrate-binding protein
MRRREFIAGLGGLVAWPFAGQAQRSSIPTIGYLNSRGPTSDQHLLVAFREGLKETGYIEGQNVVIEYRWASGQYERLPALAADLVSRHVAVIALNGPAVVAAKEATTTIPIVFATGLDPVAAGLVASLNRPGGNLTGVTNLGDEITTKLLQLVHELVPNGDIIAVVLNPAYPSVETQKKELQAAALELGLQLKVLEAQRETDFDVVFATVKQLGAAALLIGNDPFFNSRSVQFAELTLRHAVPAIQQTREFAVAGGLVGYGNSIPTSYRQAGIYTGRILQGQRPSDLPVQRTTKVELVINLKTAKALGINVPLSLLGRADEVIE